ncbi:MAG TPA: DUF1638 domain-containing protein [Candidatus Brocadiia bacterium]|nr:DUF1638 domain-containing protein [Candidatus Brocadiia bacterium]
MRLKLIACEVFYREVCHCVARSRNIVDIEFTPKGSHDDVDFLRGMLQKLVDAVDPAKYEATLLGFGICGNALNGLRADRLPLIVPRAHDCCGILLGSHARFEECFGNRLSAQWSSAGYRERGTSTVREANYREQTGLGGTYQEYVEKYGEENAKYLMEMLKAPEGDKTSIFIDLPETTHLGYAEAARVEAGKEGKTFEIVPGSIRMIQALIDGPWPESDYLRIEPGRRVKAIYVDGLITAE